MIIDIESMFREARKLAENTGNNCNWVFITDTVRDKLRLKDSASKAHIILTRYLVKKYMESNYLDYDQFVEEMTSGAVSVSSDFQDTPEVNPCSCKNKKSCDCKKD